MRRLQKCVNPKPLNPRASRACVRCAQVSFIPATTWAEVAAAPEPDWGFAPRKFPMTCCPKQARRRHRALGALPPGGGVHTDRRRCQYRRNTVRL